VEAEPEVSGGESLGAGESSVQHLGRGLEVEIPLGCGVRRLPLRILIKPSQFTNK
jgi:hypothetical protein